MSHGGECHHTHGWKMSLMDCNKILVIYDLIYMSGCQEGLMNMSDLL